MMKYLIVLPVTFALLFAPVHVVVAATGDPVIKSIGTVASDVLVITIEEGKVELGSMKPYESIPGDELDVERGRSTRLLRNGEFAGFVTGEPSDDPRFVRTPDTFDGALMPREAIGIEDDWIVRNLDLKINVTQVHRKSLVRDVADMVDGMPGVAWRHHVFLKLDQNVDRGGLTVSNPTLGLAEMSIAYDPLRTISHAIHVTEFGFRRATPSKLGSCLAGWAMAADWITKRQTIDRVRIASRHSP